MITMSQGKKENINVFMRILSIPVNTTFTGKIMANTVVYVIGVQQFKKPYQGIFIKKEGHLIYFPITLSRHIEAELIKLDYNEIDTVENYHPVDLSITYTKE